MPRRYIQFCKRKSVATIVRFLFICGAAESDHMIRDMERMFYLIADKNLAEGNMQFKIIPGARHEEKQWQEDFPKFYQ